MAEPCTGTEHQSESMQSETSATISEAKEEPNVGSGASTVPKNATTSKKSKKTKIRISSATATPQASLVIPKFPTRVGIDWKKGAKLEAMDYSDTWYPSKIIEIDGVDSYVLIHFDGWNQRYDEWFPMNSEKLRPSTRHSERKEKIVAKGRQRHPHPVSEITEKTYVFRSGERVLAKWTDCKKYPAKVNRLMEDGSYEVTFYDGITQTILPMNIQPMAKELQPKDLQEVPPLQQPVQEPITTTKVNTKPPKTLMSFKSMKLKVPESISKKLSHKSKLKAKRQLSPIKLGRPRKKLGTVEESLKTSVEPEGPSLQLKVKRLPSTGSQSESSSGDRHTVPLSQGENLMTSTEDINVGTSPGISGRNNTPTTSGATVEVMPSSSNVINVPSGPVLKHGGKKSRKRYRAGTGLDMKQRKRSKHKSVGDLPLPKKRVPSGDRTQSMDASQAIVPPVSLPPGYVFTLFAPSKAFVVESDHNPYKCQFIGCNKEFRKENLLNSHMKHYHSDTAASCSSPTAAPSTLSNIGAATSPHSAPHSTPTATVSGTMPSQSGPASFQCLHPPTGHGSVQSPVLPAVLGRRRRKKTSSICSTDSDLSVSSSKGKSSNKRRRHDSEISVTTASPDITGRDLWTGKSSSKRRRNDSEISVTTASPDIVGRDLWTGKSSSKRRRNDSEISVTTASPDIAGRDLWTDVKPRVKEEDIVDDIATDVEEPDVETEADVVNCVCGIRETGGLMIQCDVCMCWQHFACVDTGGSQEPPANYVCSICENTPGVRDSCRFMYDMGWERHGELPSFPFTGTDNGSTTSCLKAAASQCNDLMSSLHNIKSVLHSTRRQIKISKEEDDPEFQLWQTDWDHWTKPEEELLTPHSVDPVPSPTPSTFLFPPTPSLPTSHATTNKTVTVETSTASSLLSVSTNSPANFPVASLHSPLNTEGSSVLSPNPTASTSKLPAGPELFDSSSLSPPLSGSQHLPTPHPTPSSLRGSAGTRPSIQGSAGGLVRDLFPGPAGDASSSVISSVVQNGLHGSSMSPTYNQSTDELISQRRHSEEKDSNIMSEENTTSVRHSPTLSSNNGDTSGRDIDQEADNNLQTSLIPIQRTTDSDVSEHNQSNLRVVTNNTINHNEYSETIVNGSTRRNIETDYSGVHQSLGQTTSRELEEPDSLRTNTSSSLYLELADDGGTHHLNGFDDDKDDNDTDTAEESADPYKHCERNLMIHVTNVHSDIEKQLEVLEQQIIDLENSEHNNLTIHLSEDNALNDIPALKKSLGKLSNNLGKIQRLSLYH